MNNKYYKFLIAILMIVAGIYLMTHRNITWGVLLCVFSGIPILLFFRNEYILLGFWQMRKQNLEKAQKYIDKITNYKNQLYRGQYGYFHYMKGIGAAQQNPAKAEFFMKKALEYGLSFKHDRALATLNLSASAFSKGRKQEAERLLAEAKRLDSSDLMGEQIRLLKEQMKRPTMSKHMHNPNMRSRGRHF